jgi:tetratricopeptide (TPR) repeat protein
MANKKITRKELLKGPDEFLTLSSRAASFFAAHLRELKIIGIAVAVVLVGYLSVYGYMRHINNKGQEAYNLAYDALSEPPNPAKSSDPGAPAQNDDIKKAEGLFEQVIDAYGMSKAARLALPQVGHIKFTEKKYDDAIRYYDRFAEEISGHKEYEDLTFLARASCYEAKGELKKAISILTSLVEVPTNPFRETAMLSLERVYRLDNQPEKAHDILAKFVQDYKTSPFLPIAKARL